MQIQTARPRACACIIISYNTRSHAIYYQEHMTEGASKLNVGLEFIGHVFS